MKKLFFIILYSAFLICNSFCVAQNKNIDSLLTLLKKDKPDTSKVIHLNKLCWEYMSMGIYDTALQYGNGALKMAQQLLEHSQNKRSAELLKIKKCIANSYNNIGAVYYYQGDFLKTLVYWLKALKIDEELKDKKGIGRRLGNIGQVYYNQEDYIKALAYYFKALKMAEDLGDKNTTATTLNSIGLVYSNQADYTKALDCYFKALKIAEDLRYKQLQIKILCNTGNVYGKQAEGLIPLSQKKLLFNKALDTFFKGLKMSEELGDKYSLAVILGNIGLFYTRTGKFKEAEQYLKKAGDMNERIGALDALWLNEEHLSQLYDSTGLYKEALIHYRKAMTLKDTIFSQENKKQLVRNEMNYEFDKKEASTKAENDKLQAIAEEKNHKQKIITGSVAAGLLIVIVFAGFVFRSLRITRKQKQIIEIKNQETEI